MAYTYVKDILDFEENAIKIAREYGGGSGTVDLGLIADNYNPDRTTSYPVNDMVVYNGKLYRATSETKASAGTFDPTMWSKFDDYDSTQTYNTDQIVVYEGTPYRCTENGVTGDWDATKWADMSSYFTEYDETSTSYYPYSTLVEYDGDFYRSTTFTPTGAVGEFNTSNWTETTVEAVINDNKPKSIVLCNSSEIATDAKGYITNTLNLPNMFAIHLTEVFFSGSMIPGGESMYPYYVVNGGTLAGKGVDNKHYPVLRLYSKTTGEPVASMAAGTISDMSILTAIYFND